MRKQTRSHLMWAALGFVAMMLAFALTTREGGRLELGGIYEGEKISATITQVQPNEYRADLSNVDRRCREDITVYGQRIENVIPFILPVEGNAKGCRIAAKWNSNGQRVTFKHEPCDALPKNACRYEGKLTRVSKVKPPKSDTEEVK